MALYIVLESGEELIRYIGSKLPYRLPSDVAEIQADGDEKTFIEKSSSTQGLVHAPKKRVVRYFGETAKYIVANVFDCNEGTGEPFRPGPDSLESLQFDIETLKNKGLN